MRRCPDGGLDPCVSTLNLVWLIMGNVMKLVILGREVVVLGQLSWVYVLT